MPASPSVKSKLSSNQSSVPGSSSSPFQSSNNSKPSFLPEGQKTKFQSEDSEGSDISYESSIQSQDDINIGRVDFFKEEMSRFFINYPELINHEIIDNQMVNQNNLENYFLRNNNANNANNANNINNTNINGAKKTNNIFQSSNKSNKTTLNKNWSAIADQILNQAKQSTSFLQDLSRRIALYRSKVQQQDLIDLLLNLVGKDEQVPKRKHSQHSNNKSIHNSPKESDRKRRSLNKTNQNYPTNKLQRNNSTQQKQNNKSGGAFFVTQDQPKQPLTMLNSPLQNNNQTSPKMNHDKLNSPSLTKSNSQRQSTSFSKVQSPLKLGNKNSFNINDTIKQNPVDSFLGLQKQNKSNYNPTQTFWKHLVNFQPRTEAGRQLCELIRKTNSPNDQLGIKKTIMTFLSRSKDLVQNQIVLKSTISQKIQKLYNDDSKQLLMFYPTRMSSLTNNNIMNNSQNINTNPNTNVNNNPKQPSGSQNSSGKDQLIDSNNNTKFFNANNTNTNSNKQSSQINENNKMFQQGEKFMKVLEDIVEGPLMKYWMSIQENKL